MIYPKPYSIYLRGVITKLSALIEVCVSAYTTVASPGKAVSGNRICQNEETP